MRTKTTLLEWVTAPIWLPAMILVAVVVYFAMMAAEFIGAVMEGEE